MTSQLRRRHRTGSRERGASLVEFAFILPVFAMLIFGLITAGLALNEKQEMTQATREGARYAATIPADQTGLPDTWARTVRKLIADRSAGTLTEAEICVSLVQGDNPTSAITTAAHSDPTYFSTAPSGAACIADEGYPATAADNGRRVQVRATKDAELDLVVFGTYPLDLESEATAKSESNL